MAQQQMAQQQMAQQPTSWQKIEQQPVMQNILINIVLNNSIHLKIEVQENEITDVMDYIVGCLNKNETIALGNKVIPAHAVSYVFL